MTSSSAPRPGAATATGRVWRMAAAGTVAVYAGTWLALVHWPLELETAVSLEPFPEPPPVITVGSLHLAALGVTLGVIGTVLLVVAAAGWLSADRRSPVPAPSRPGPTSGPAA